jgi:hypothetical protein
MLDFGILIRILEEFCERRGGGMPLMPAHYGIREVKLKKRYNVYYM